MSEIEKAMEYLYDITTDAIYCITSDEKDAINLAIQVLEEKLEREHVGETNGMLWIPVSEKLPEKQQTVIVYSQYGTSLGWILWNEWMTIEGLCKPGATVTHWMPLPKPPQEVE